MLRTVNNCDKYLKFGLFRLRKSIDNKALAMSYSTSKKWENFIEEERKYGKLIYKGQLTSKLKTIKMFSISTSVVGLCFVPYICNLQEMPLFGKIIALGTTSLFTFCTPVFLQLLTRRHVNRMYFDYEKDVFTAFIYSFFLSEYKIEFNLKDIEVSDGFFTTLLIKNHKNRPLFVDYDQIYDVNLIEKILGYDKPLDLKKYDK
jgi:hypothetical protein